MGLATEMPNEFEEHHKARMERRAAEEAAAEMRRAEILQRATKIQSDALEFASQRRIVIGCHLNSPEVQLTKDGRQLTITVNGIPTRLGASGFTPFRRRKQFPRRRCAMRLSTS